jgi:DNA-binding NarL/FixJ family response regulator
MAAQGGDPCLATASRLGVVLIDDAKPERELLWIWLEESGHFTVDGEAADGPGGVALVTKLRPELVVLDLSMPGGDGIPALTEILSVSPLSRPVVFSGFLSAGLADGLISLGASACLDKSAGPARLIAELLRLVDIS